MNNFETSSSEETSQENFSPLLATTSTASSYVYNVPDAFEDDPEIIRSENLFFSSPFTEQYSQLVYSTLMNIQDQCSVDYDTLCDDDANAQQNFDSLVNSFLSTGISIHFYNRKLAALKAWESKEGAQFLQSLRSLYLPSLIGNRLLTLKTLPNANEILKYLSSKRPEVISKGPINRPSTKFSNDKNFKSSVVKPSKRTLRDEHSHHGEERDHDHDSHHKDDHEVANDATDGKSSVMWPKMNQPTPRKDSPCSRESVAQGSNASHDPPMRPAMGEAKRDGRSEEEPDEAFENHQRFDDPPHHHDWHTPDHFKPQEDLYFSGALGFGAEGDVCMYQNIPQLSEPCLSSVVDLYELRDQYWQQQQDMVQGSQMYYHHHHHGFFLLLLSLLALLWMIRRCRVAKKVKEIRTFFDAIKANPTLQAAVESQTGLKVPVMSKPCRCVHDPSSNQRSFFARFIKTVAFFSLICISSLLISISSLEITAAIVNSIDNSMLQQRNAEGSSADDVQLVSPFAALMTLIAVSAIEVGLFVLLVKYIRYLRAVHHQNDAATSFEHRLTTPTAPLEPSSPGRGVTVGAMVIYPTVTEVSASMEGGQPRQNRVRRGRMWNFGEFPSQLFSFRSTNPEGYAPLLTSEDHKDVETTFDGHSRTGYSAEMVNVSTHNGSVPIAIVPVTAHTVSSINFV